MNSRSAEVLTPREQEVIELLSAGRSNDEIARQLGISRDGVKYHVSGIFRRLRVKNRQEAASLHLGTEGGVLTPREQEVIELLSTGLTNEEIARQLGISLDGVKYHVSGILRRLDVESRHDAAALHLRTAPSGRLASWAPFIFLRKLPFASVPKAAAGAVLTAAAVGISLLAWGVMSTSSASVTTTGCGVEQTGGTAPDCGPGVAQGATGADDVSAISAGDSYTCAVKDGGAWCWGGTEYDSLTTPSLVLPVPGLASGVTEISTTDSGRRTGCAIKDGGVWCWHGYNSAMAVPGLESGVSAISAGFGHTCAVKGGGVWCLNWDIDEDAPVPVLALSGGGRVSAISGNCALREAGSEFAGDGGVWCWYTAPNGRPVAYPVRSSAFPSGIDAVSGNCALKDGAVLCAGTVVPGLTSGVSAISERVGYGFNACAVKDGGVWCWGANDKGYLGNNSTTDSPVPVAVSGLESGVSAISAGVGHTCAVKDGDIWCWGENHRGQLGNNRPSGSDGTVAVRGLESGVSAIEGDCALKDGGVWCWGSNGAGESANNSTADSIVPVAVRGLESGVSAIVEGDCALKDGGVWCWGSNGAGQSANNSIADSTVPVAVPAALSGLETRVSSCALRDGAVLCDGTVVPGLESGVSVADGDCALKDGGVWCWAQADDLASGPVSGLNSGVSAISAEEGGHHCALKDGGVYCWSPQYGHNGDIPSSGVAMPRLESGVSAISGTCALKEGGVWCWGRKDAAPAYSPVPVPVLFTPPGAVDLAERPDAQPQTSQTANDSADHRAAYVLVAAAAVLAVVAAGAWALRRRRRTS